MKTRLGFVSNSSSSSFVAVLPHGFDFESLNIERLYDSLWGAWDTDHYDVPSKKAFKKDLIKTIKAAIKSKDGLDEGGGYEDIDFVVLEEALAKYIVASWETHGGSGSGHCVILDAGKISNCAQNKRRR